MQDNENAISLLHASRLACFLRLTNNPPLSLSLTSLLAHFSCLSFICRLFPIRLSEIHTVHSALYSDRRGADIQPHCSRPSINRYPLSHFALPTSSSSSISFSFFLPSLVLWSVRFSLGCAFLSSVAHLLLRLDLNFPFYASTRLPPHHDPSPVQSEQPASLV